MKKIYASAVLTLLAGSVAFGQQAKDTFEHLPQSKNRTFTDRTEVTTIDNALRGGGGPLWSNNFDTPGDWTIDNEAGNTDDWVIGSAGPAGPFAIAAITSTSGGNFALFDSDNYCSGDQVANVTTAMPITVLAATPGVILQFEQNYRRFNDSTFVLVSTDGTNWDKYHANENYGTNDSSPNPELVQVNITPTAGNAATVWIRFQFWSPSTYSGPGAGGPGCAYAWMIDDVEIHPAPANDLKVSNSWHGDIINDYEYAKIPASQSYETVIGAVVTNNGGMAQTNVGINWDISTGGSSVASGTAPGPVAQLVGQTDTIWTTTGFTPSVLGDYTVTVTAFADSTELNPADNELTSEFEITDFVYAHDDGNYDINTGGYLDDNDQPLNYQHGNVYVANNGGDQIYAVQASFGSTITTNGSFTAYVYEEIGFNDVVEESSNIWDVVSGANNGDIVTIVLDDPVTMNAGSVYMVALEVQAGDVMFFQGNSQDDDFGARVYGELGANPGESWFVPGSTPAIRANTDMNIGIISNDDIRRMTIQPNPATDAIRIKLTIDNSRDLGINVIGLDGKVVYTENNQSFAGEYLRTIDVTDFAEGIYFVQVSTDNAVHTEKIVVSH